MRHIAEQGYGREATLLDLAEWLLDVSSRPETFSLAASLVPGSYRGTVKWLEDGKVESTTCFNVTSKRAVADGIDAFVLTPTVSLPPGSWVTPQAVRRIARLANAPSPRIDARGLRTRVS